MTNQMHFQFPGLSTGHLQEVLLDALDGATSGGGVFAWCNKGGNEALFRDRAFAEFLAAGYAFELVVGLDSITDEAAIHDLQDLEHTFPSFSAKALLHAQSSAIFHPKFSWFRGVDSLRTIIGSGNLTLGGLRKNWEVSISSEFRGDQVSVQEQAISAYLTQLAPYTLPLSDPAVLARARENRRPTRATVRRPTAAIARTSPTTTAQQVLVAEIPRSDNRWNQANFDQASFTNFFGATPNRSQRIILRAVDASGVLGRVESRPSVAVRSQNYRFELAAAHGLPYPDVSRPIGVFLRQEPGDFLYQLIMPSEPIHSAVARFLTRNAPPKSRQVRRFRADRGLVQAALPGLALWAAADGSQDVDL